MSARCNSRTISRSAFQVAMSIFAGTRGQSLPLRGNGCVDPRYVKTRCFQYAACSNCCQIDLRPWTERAANSGLTPRSAPSKFGPCQLRLSNPLQSASMRIWRNMQQSLLPLPVLGERSKMSAMARDFTLRAMRPTDWDEIAALIYESLNAWYSTVGRSRAVPGGGASMRVFPEVYEALDPGCCVVAQHTSG